MSSLLGKHQNGERVQKILGKIPEIIGTHVWYSPLWLNISITNVCNLSCTMCTRNFLKYHKRQMDLDTFKEIIKQQPKAKHINFCGIGEVFCHPNFMEMLELIKQKTKATISFSTNGTYLDNDTIIRLIKLKVDKLSVSIDGTEETYEGIRKKSYNDLYNKLVSLNMLKASMKSTKPELEIEFVCLNQNIETLPKMPILAKNLEAKGLYLLHPLCLTHEASKNHIHGSEENKIQALLDHASKNCRENNIVLKKRTTQPKPMICPEPWYQMTIVEDGSIRPCCFVGNLYSNFTEHYLGTSFEVNPEDYTLGNIFEGIDKVWKGDSYKTLRHKLVNIRKNEKDTKWDKNAYIQLRNNCKGNYCEICQFRFQTAC